MQIQRWTKLSILHQTDPALAKYRRVFPTGYDSGKAPHDSLTIEILLSTCWSCLECLIWQEYEKQRIFHEHIIVWIVQQRGIEVPWGSCGRALHRNGYWPVILIQSCAVYVFAFAVDKNFSLIALANWSRTPKHYWIVVNEWSVR